MNTPRTEAALIDNGELVGQFPEWVRADFARQLETELAEALSQRNQTISELATFVEDNRRLETEAQELREALDKLVNRNCQFFDDEARLRFGNFAEAISTVNDARAILARTGGNRD